MNATIRASLVAAIAIFGTCWAIPALLVRTTPPDAGMMAMMALFYIVQPAASIALGVLAARSARALFWIPALHGIAFALLLPLAIEGTQDVAFYGIAYAAIGYITMGLRSLSFKQRGGRQ